MSARSLMLTLCLTLTGTLHAEENEGFVPLFDGQSLAGWHGGAEFWKVEDGAIVGHTDGNIPDNTFLISEKSYGDFILKVKWKLHHHRGNSGIQFRSEELPAEGKRPPFVVKGYQADIADNHFLGILYGEKTGRGIIVDLDAELKAKVAEVIRKDDWNEYVITARGSRITQVLNGVTTVDLDDPEGARSGIIALQLHRGQDMTISFKDLLIKELK